MKVLQVINSLSGGGAESFVTDLSISLSKDRKIALAILVYAGILDKKGEILSQRLTKNGIKVYSLNVQKNLKKIAIPYRYYRIIREIDPDIIHSHLDQSDFFLAMTKLFFPSFDYKMVRTIHVNGVIKKLPLCIHKKVFKSFDLSIACSDSVKSEYQLKKLRADIVSIPNGITILENRRKSDSTSSKIVFISVGSFTPRLGVMQKSQDLIIKAMKLVQNNSIEVHFLGDGTKLEEMKQKAEDLNLKDRLHFHGMVPDVYEYFSKGDALLFPSRFEGLPISVIEATTFGLPVITANIAAFEPFQSSSSLTFSLENVNDLARKIEYMAVNINRFTSEAMKNKKEFCKKFDIANVARKYNNFYNKVLDK